MAASSSSRLSWTILFLVIIPLIGYALYSGLTIGKIQLPGGFVIEFREAPQVDSELPDDRYSDLGKDELVSRQAELEQRLREMEAQIQRQQTDAPEEMSGPNLTGNWQSAQGLTYAITQQGAALTIQEINPFYGITAIGEGTLGDGTIVLSYRTAANTVGEGRLKLSANGRRLSGTFRDTYSGFTTPVQLQKTTN